MTTLKLNQPRLQKIELTANGVRKRRTLPPPPTATLYNLKKAPHGLRPQTKTDIQNFALDLLSSGSRDICTTRSDAFESIWLYQPFGKSARLGRKIPDWDDLRPPLDGTWIYKNDGEADLYKNHVIDKYVSPPDMHAFNKPSPTGLDVFITPEGKDLGGYVKFFIRPSGTGHLFLASFHEDRRNGQPNPLKAKK